ncbi:MAG: amidophosphoribosyltransferase [Acidobacteria bacterium]|nr:amidophosphoribosyltransferase [Acidobacteriota bacterium]
MDKLHHECGVFGIYDHPDAARITYLGLYALQHRGQESAGISTSDGLRLTVEKGMGYVADVFEEERLARLGGSHAIGHVRYSTAGESSLANGQPILMDSARGPLALGHNGNLVNALRLRRELQKEGAAFVSTSDSEVILHLIARSPERSLENAIVEALRTVLGAFSILLQSPDKIIAARDPYGFRPLCLGQLDGSHVIASETCAFDLIGATYIRDIEPGEVLVVDGQGLRSITPFPQVQRAFCVFEHIYFARPDSQIFGKSVNRIRLELGRQLAREAPADADIVVPVPDSGMTAAIGYAREAGLPFELGLIRNHYVGRTFIEPKQAIRHVGVKVKLNPVRDVLEGRRVILIDDSIVRGTTSAKIVQMVRSAGARQVHLRISSPPIVGPCFYGIDTPSKQELIGANHDVEEIRRFVCADTLKYLSLTGLMTAVGEGRSQYCSACFTDKYPIPVDQEQQRSLFRSL